MKTLTAALLLSLLSSGSATAGPATAPAAACPLDIVPGVSLGPVKLGDTLPGPARAPSDTDFREDGPIHARYCGGKAVDLWLDDLRLAPKCITLNGKPLARDVTLDALKKQFGDCRDAPPRIGGAFVECAGGAIRFGYGMGTFLQVRVGAKGTELDAECADFADDGRPVPLSTAERDALLQRVLDLDLLAPYWHPDRPGRRPLTVLTTDAVGGLAGAAPSALTIFGAPVQWVSPDDPAVLRTPLFEFTKLESTARRVRIEFRYPPEGVVGHVSFKRRGDAWHLAEKKVSER